MGLQVDEPALREGLPLKRERWESYLDWGVRAFRYALSSLNCCGVVNAQ